MTKFMKTLSFVSALVLAATPVLAIGGGANAAESGMRPVHVVVGDLDFASSQGVAVYHQRVDAAAEAFCSQGAMYGLGQIGACRQAVRDEVDEKLSASQRMSLLVVKSSPHAWRVSAR